MHDHIYQYFWICNVLGVLLLIHYMRLNKNTNKLYELRGFEKMANFTIQSFFATSLVIIALYFYIVDGLDNKIEIISSVAIPFWLINVIFTLRSIKNDQNKLIEVIESLQLISEVLTIYYKSDLLKKKLQKTLQWLNRVYIFLMICVIPAIYYYIFSNNLKIYAALLMTCSLSAYNGSYIISSLHILANEMCILRKIIKRLSNKKIHSWYCYVCKKRFNKRDNYDCLLHQMRSLGIT